MLIHIEGSKVVLGTISDNMAQKPLFYAHFWRFFGQTSLRNSVAMAAGSKSGFRDDFGQYVAKPLFYAHFWRFSGQTPLRNSVAMATPKIPGDQN